MSSMIRHSAPPPLPSSSLATASLQAALRLAERCLTTQSKVAHILAEARSFAAASNQILRILTAQFDWQTGAIWLIDKERGQAELFDIWCTSELKADLFVQFNRDHSFAAGVGLPGRVWQNGAALWLTDVDAIEANLPGRALMQAAGLHSALGFPIILDGQVLGVMEFFSRHTTPPAPEVLDLGTTIGSQLGQFIRRWRAEAELVQEKGFLTAVLDTAGSLVLVLNRRGRIVSFNRACETLTGYAANEVLDVPFWSIFTPPDETSTTINEFEQLSAGNFPMQVENVWLNKDGERRVIAWTNTALLDKGGLVEYVIGIGIDMTKQRQREAAELQSESRYRTFFSATPNPILIFSLEGKIIDVNPAAAALLEYPLEELIGSNATMIVPDEGEWIADLHQLLLKNKVLPSYDRTVHTKTGKEIRVELKLSLIRDDTAPHQHIQCVAHDVTDRYEQEQRLHYLSHHDHLTGLTNRRSIEKQLSHSLNRSHCNDALLFIDLDSFKRINDTPKLGHAAGDMALCYITELLKQGLRRNDLLARLGGDEFAILLPDTDQHHAQQIAYRLCQLVANHPFNVEGYTFMLGLSIGLTELQAGEKVETLVNRADEAMYCAKKAGGGRVVVHLAR